MSNSSVAILSLARKKENNNYYNVNYKNELFEFKAIKAAIHTVILKFYIVIQTLEFKQQVSQFKNAF